MAPLAKCQRWTDLLVALLSHRAGLTFGDLVREVPGYRNALRGPDANEDSVKRTFERDKKELRALGVPIDTIGAEGDEDTSYRVKSTDFYLPYLAVATPRGRHKPAELQVYGYRSLRTLDFVPDELLAIADAASRARQMGDPALSADVESAMRKLAFDLPLDAVVAPVDAHIVATRAAADPEVLEELGAALLHRKRIAMTYHTMESGSESSRTVDPWGLFWGNGHWYLAARDVDRDAVRNFRVSRIRDVAPANGRLADADYDIPGDFDLRDHARTRQPWELGDGDAVEAIVELRNHVGATMAAGALGTPVAGLDDTRRFAVRRVDAFARWLLSFAGGAVPIAPPAVVDEFRRQLTATTMIYDDVTAA